MIDILVPVLGRGHQIEPLLANIAGVTDVDWRVTFICSPDDPAAEICLGTEQTTIVVPWQPARADFAKKINLAYDLIEDADWFFQGATDLVFHGGWASQALRTANAGRIGVVGTNDLGNPAVKRGNHATHILFSRDYIERFDGGVYDNTGRVFSEQYDHQFVDTEFVQTAILRGQFKPCLRSVVEHMHPHWGKGEMDETYVKSERSFRDDSAIYNNRMREARRAMQPLVRGGRRR